LQGLLIASHIATGQDITNWARDQPEVQGENISDQFIAPMSYLASIGVSGGGF